MRKRGAAADVGAECRRARRHACAAAGRTARCRGTGSTSRRTTSRRPSSPSAAGPSRRDGCSARTRRARAAGRSGRRRRDSCGSTDRARPPTPLRPRFSATCDCRKTPGCSSSSRPQARAGARSTSGRSAASPHRRAARDRATARSAPCCRRSPIRRCRGRTSGTLRSISTLPAMTRIERARAPLRRMASTEALWVVANTIAVVVPLRSSSARKNSATSRACSGSANRRFGRERVAVRATRGAARRTTR